MCFQCILYTYDFHFQPFFIKTISFDSYPSYPEFVTSILEARGTTFGVQGYAATLAAVPQTSIHQGSGEDSRVYGWSNLPLTQPPGQKCLALMIRAQQKPMFFPFVRPGWLEGDVNKQVFFLVVIFLFQVAVQIHLDVDDMKICIRLVDHWGDVFGLISLVYKNSTAGWQRRFASNTLAVCCIYGCFC